MAFNDDLPRDPNNYARPATPGDVLGKNLNSRMNPVNRSVGDFTRMNAVNRSVGDFTLMTASLVHDGEIAIAGDALRVLESLETLKESLHRAGIEERML